MTVAVAALIPAMDAIPFLRQSLTQHFFSAFPIYISLSRYRALLLSDITSLEIAWKSRNYRIIAIYIYRTYA